MWPFLGFTSLRVRLSSQFFAGQRLLYQVILAIRTQEVTENIQQDKATVSNNLNLEVSSYYFYHILFIRIKLLGPALTLGECTGYSSQSPAAGELVPHHLHQSQSFQLPLNVTNHHLPSKNSHYFRCRQMQHILREPGFCSTACNA